jgi:hypothetical protein
MVNELQNEIIKLQPVLQTAAKETAELIHIVTKDKEAAAVVQANVEEEATKVCIFSLVCVCECAPNETDGMIQIGINDKQAAAVKRAHAMHTHTHTQLSHTHR